MNKFFTFFLFTAGLLTACQEDHSTAPETLKVKTCTAERISPCAERSYSFLSEPYRTSELSFRVGGPISRLDVQSGQFFRKGQVIAEIDSRDYVIRNEKAKAAYLRAKADYERLYNLFLKGNVSASSYEKAKADYELAQANYTDTQNQLGDTRLIAPFDGYIQTVHAEQFQDIKPTVPVVTLIDLHKIKATACVPENFALEFSPKETAAINITFNAFPGKQYAPTEAFLSQSVGSNNISYNITAIIDNKNGILMGGMAGKITLPSGTSPATPTVAVPLTAVCRDATNHAYVWSVQPNSTVQKCPVRLGQLQKGNKVEITAGLATGQRIATNHLQQLTEGQSIHVE